VDFILPDFGSSPFEPMKTLCSLHLVEGQLGRRWEQLSEVAWALFICMLGPVARSTC